MKNSGARKRNQGKKDFNPTKNSRLIDYFRDMVLFHVFDEKKNIIVSSSNDFQIINKKENEEVTMYQSINPI